MGETGKPSKGEVTTKKIYPIDEDGKSDTSQPPMEVGFKKIQTPKAEDGGDTPEVTTKKIYPIDEDGKSDTSQPPMEVGFKKIQTPKAEDGGDV